MYSLPCGYKATVWSILIKLQAARQRCEDLGQSLRSFATILRHNSLCGLGQTAPNPVLSTLKYFRDEYVAHVVDKKCPAGVCKDLFFSIRLSTINVRAAHSVPVTALWALSAVLLRNPHEINQTACIKCGACMC